MARSRVPLVLGGHGEVVPGLGEGRVARDRDLPGDLRLGRPPLRVEHVAEVERQDRIVRIGAQGGRVEVSAVARSLRSSASSASATRSSTLRACLVERHGRAGRSSSASWPDSSRSNSPRRAFGQPRLREMAAAPAQRDRRLEDAAQLDAARQQPAGFARGHQVAVGVALVDRLEHVEQGEAGEERRASGRRCARGRPRRGCGRRFRRRAARPSRRRSSCSLISAAALSAARPAAARGRPAAHSTRRSGRRAMTVTRAPGLLASLPPRRRTSWSSRRRVTPWTRPTRNSVCPASGPGSRLQRSLIMRALFRRTSGAAARRLSAPCAPSACESRPSSRPRRASRPRPASCSAPAAGGRRRRRRLRPRGCASGRP